MSISPETWQKVLLWNEYLYKMTRGVLTGVILSSFTGFLYYRAINEPALKSRTCFKTGLSVEMLSLFVNFIQQRFDVLTIIASNHCNLFFQAGFLYSNGV